MSDGHMSNLDGLTHEKLGRAVLNVVRMFPEHFQPGTVGLASSKVVGQLVRIAAQGYGRHDTVNPDLGPVEEESEKQDLEVGMIVVRTGLQKFQDAFGSSYEAAVVVRLDPLLLSSQGGLHFFGGYKRHDIARTGGRLSGNQLQKVLTAMDEYVQSTKPTLTSIERATST